MAETLNLILYINYIQYNISQVLNRVYAQHSKKKFQKRMFYLNFKNLNQKGIYV